MCDNHQIYDATVTNFSGLGWLNELGSWIT